MKHRWAALLIAIVVVIFTGCGGREASEPEQPDPWEDSSLTGTASIEQLTILTEDIRKYHKVELAFDIPAFHGNPFDPKEIEVFGEFYTPSGDTLVMPGFWYVGLMGQNSGWRIRISPTEPGDWTFAVKVRLGNDHADVRRGEFSAADSSRPGFIRVNPANGRRFMFDNGDPYIALGQNVCWSTSVSVTQDYTNWYRNMAENGANFSRVWMAPWGFSLEWTDTGLGDYSKRMGRALMLDTVMELAEDLDIYTMLVFLNHGQFSTKTNPEWHGNPFNTANGGFLDSPEQFFTNEEAKNLFMQRIRYIIARWGYSTHIMSWELWNEVNLTDRYHPRNVEQWHREMAAFIRELDPYQHLISTSGYTAASPTIFEGMDFVNLHGYSMRNFPRDIAKFQRDAMKKTDQPLLFSEMGIFHDGQQTRREDPKGIHLHQGLWAGVMSGGAGTGMTWWWDSYVHPERLYPLFKPISDFLPIYLGRIWIWSC